MNTATIIKLNQLNKDFYQQVAASFSKTRQTAWPGWEKCWQIVDQQLRSSHSTALSIFDVGCGNGRFGQFCREHLDDQVLLEYVGIDQDERLLADAESSLNDLPATNCLLLPPVDIVEQLLTQQQLLINTQNFQVVACFGVLHHIPSQELRIQLVKHLSGYVEEGGLLLLACWQFDRNETLLSRQRSSEELGFTQKDLEENDHFLTWERELNAVRYCHLVDETEQDALIRESGLRLIDRFSADGKTNDQNEYLILQKNSLTGSA